MNPAITDEKDLNQVVWVELQLRDSVSTTIVDGLPVVSIIGFYPTVETMMGQAVLLVLVGAAMVYKKKQK
ncbi:hypothetical protein [Cytobacillus massiliigabonensis]|uniref:hypothetical protein n=1 Tax=Cytobacillus massiliigabonensis TaxID=1871011 RepID=UPI001F198D97|nr:hypothetical protein [Cytobacillus massiliigabonensis]